MAEVAVEGVSKAYPGGVEAIRNATLTVGDGEFLVLVGPSGCGKSTLLRMIAGLEEITSGTIRIGERVVNELPPKDRDIAMVFQDYALYPHMTVAENLAFGLRMRRCPSAEIAARTAEAAELLGLRELLARRPKQLSGGQRQRVAVGRAIVRKPAVFLFDEPLSNLDAKLRVEMRAELKRLHASLRTTTVYVTHDQVEAMTLGERIVVLRDGVVQQLGPPLELYERPANRFAASFLGTPPMNFLAGRLESRAGGVWFTDGDLRWRLPDAQAAALAAYVGNEVEIGVRPERLLPTEEAAVNRFEARVEVVEPLGYQTLLYLKTRRQALIALVDAHESAAAGGAWSAAPPPEALHVFERSSGRNLTA